MSEWVRASFDVATFHGRGMRVGFVRDGLGVHRGDFNRWIVTHLRSGCGFYWRGKTAKQAKAVADLVLKNVPDFATVGKFGAGESIPRKTVCKVRELMEDLPR